MPAKSFITSPTVIKPITNQTVKLKFNAYENIKILITKRSIKAKKEFLLFKIENASMVLLINLKKEKIKTKIKTFCKTR